MSGAPASGGLAPGGGLPRLTRKGALAAVAAAALTLGGLALDNPFLVAAGVGLVALLAVGAYRVGGVALNLRREVAGDVANEGDDVGVTLTVEAAGDANRLFFELEDRLPGAFELVRGSNYALLDVGEGAATLRYAVRSPVKGKFTIGPVLVRLEDAFGLFHRDERFPTLTELKVYPRSEDLRDALTSAKHPLMVSGDHMVGQPGGGTSFFALREYFPGDPMRAVNWKASARSEELVVNQRERESQAVATILYDARAQSQLGTVRANGHAAGARAVVSLMGYLLGRRDRVRLVAYGDGLTEVAPMSPERQAHEVREALVGLEPAGDTTLGDAVDELLPTLKPRSPVILVSNLTGDATVASAVRSLRAREARVVVVSPGLPEGLDDAHYAVARLEREAALRELRAYGATVVDWNPEDNLLVAMGEGVVE